jgi:hypothetical protein
MTSSVTVSGDVPIQKAYRVSFVPRYVLVGRDERLLAPDFHLSDTTIAKALAQH